MPQNPVADIAQSFDRVNSSDSADKAINKLSDFVANMSGAETLQVLKQINASERKGVGMDIKFDTDGSIFLTSPYQKQDMDITITDTNPASASDGKHAAKIDPEIQTAADKLLAMPGFAQTGKIDSDRFPNAISIALEDNKGNLGEMNKEFNQALEASGSPYRVEFDRRGGLAGMHGNTMYEESLAVTDSRTGKQTQLVAHKMDSARGITLQGF